MFINTIWGSLGFAIISLLTFAILQWLHIPAGNLVDWLIGIASFWWLLVIVTVPWNIYFDAREVLAEASISEEQGIPVDQKQVNYVKFISRWSIVVAIALHFLSAIGLYSLAATGISNIGYISSALTLMLTALRPAIRTYQYLATRLSMIRQQVKYPREDILELRQKVYEIETTVKRLETDLNPENPNSLVTNLREESQMSRKELAKLRATTEQLEARNESEHKRLEREGKNAIAQLNEDSQFLGHVREIIRFIKTT